MTTNTASCNKFPCVLYPKSAQLSTGRIVATFEDDEGVVVGQTMPIYKSDDNGNTWQKLTSLKAPAYLTSNSAFANYTSAWTNPFFYVLPQAIGSMAAGTLLLASVVGRGLCGLRARGRRIDLHGAGGSLLDRVFRKPILRRRQAFPAA